MIPNSDPSQATFKILPRIGSFEVSFKGIVRILPKRYIFYSWSSPNCYQACGLTMTPLQSAAKVSILTTSRVKISESMLLLVKRTREKDIKELRGLSHPASSHQMLQWPKPPSKPLPQVPPSPPYPLSNPPPNSHPFSRSPLQNSLRPIPTSNHPPPSNNPSPNNSPLPNSSNNQLLK